MPTVADNVLVALTGSALVAPVGTTAPTLATTTWTAASVAWVDLGYVSEDGITESHEDDTAEIPAWQRGDVVRRLITGSSAQYQLMLIETTKAALELYHKGSPVVGVHASGHGPASQQISSPTVDRRAFGFDIIDGAKIVRMVIPQGEVTERGEIVYKNDEPIGFELTVTAYPASNGVHTIKYYSDLAGLPLA